MILLSIKKLENEIKNRTITPKQFIIYSIFVLVPFLSLVKTSKYPVNMEAYDIDTILSSIPFTINIIKYIMCYKIIKNKDINLFLYSIIPINFVLSLKYSLFLMLPMIVVFNIFLIRLFDLDFSYWNVINSRLISIIFETIIAINTLKIFKKIYSCGEKYNIIV
jgi:hypothetical protein